MPVDRVPRSPSNRSTPLPKGRYTIPGSLPPAFGVDELFDWSSARASTPTASARSPPTGHSTFQRNFQKRTSPSVRAWVKGQEGHSPLDEKSRSDTFSIAGTDHRRPLFAPTRSPTPTKRGSSQVLLQLPSPTPSPLKPEPKLRPTLVASESASPPNSTRKHCSSSICQTSIPRRSAGHSSQRIQEESSDASETSDVEVLSDSGEAPDGELFEKDESEGQSEAESGAESELSRGSGWVRASRYFDYAAREARDTKGTNAHVRQATASAQGRWMGGTQGVLSFRKRPGSQEVGPPGKWSFSNDGVAKQPLKDRQVGDIHFCPGYSGESEDNYWVCVDYPKRRWAQCTEGQAHPNAAGYVLRPRDGNKPPQWILAQSLRANKSRGRRSME